MAKRLFLLFLVITSSMQLYAQFDAGRAALFLDYRNKATKVLAAQDALQGIRIIGHSYIENEQKKIANFQRQLDEYLSNLEKTLTYLGDVYALYYEVKQSTQYISDLKSVVIHSPDNVIGLAFSKSRKGIYNDLIDHGSKTLGDIKLLFSKEKKDKTASILENLSPSEKEKARRQRIKASTYQRFQLLNKVREDLRLMNKKLHRLAILIRSTSLLDAWYEIRQVPRPKRSMEVVTKESYARWKRRLSTVKVRRRVI